ncbi:MAG TPA: ABC transporter permease [Bryobacteraceae bacterium]|nr:ABC transporter permease [Bryobacteraceae bacterium]
MIRDFEFFVARRYLRAKRKQAVISVITFISIIGVAAGVMALVIALAINNGFRNTLQRNLLGATAHVSILEKEPGFGIQNWREVAQRVKTLPHVLSATPSLYGGVMFSGPLQAAGGILKGVDPATARDQTDILRHLKAGSLAGLSAGDGMPGIILGSRLAQNTGMTLGSVIRVISPQGELTPFGPHVTSFSFKVVGLFESGFYELDANWAYTSLQAAQQVLSLEDVVNAIEIKTDDIDRAGEIAKAAEAISGPKLAATNWKEQNRPILNALKMEKSVTVVTIGLIQLVAALNILIALIMMVMEKHRDIAILMSMGARHQQIRRIFMFQGVLIGVIGTAIGLVAGYSICYFGDKYRWIRLDEEVYSLSFVPFEPRWTDALWIAGVAILVSFIATLYPARSATRITPVEALRYE